MIREFDPPKRLSYTFITSFNEAWRRRNPSRVTLRCWSRTARYVKLTVTHDDFAPGSMVLPSIAKGWPAMLSSLKSLLETRRPLPLSAMQSLADKVGANIMDIANTNPASSIRSTSQPRPRKCGRR